MANAIYYWLYQVPFSWIVFSTFLIAGPGSTMSQEILLNTADRRIVEFNIETCEMVTLVYTDSVFGDIAFNPLTGKLIGISYSEELFEIDLVNGDLTFIAQLQCYGLYAQYPVLCHYNSLVADHEGLFYLSNPRGHIVTYNIQTKEERYLGDIPYTVSGDVEFFDDKLHCLTRFGHIVRIDNLIPLEYSVLIQDSNIGANAFGMFISRHDCDDVQLYTTKSLPNGITSFIYRYDKGMHQMVQHCQLEGIVINGAASVHSAFKSTQMEFCEFELTQVKCDKPIELSSTVCGGTGRILYSLNNNLSEESGAFSDLQMGQNTLSVIDEWGCKVDTLFTVYGLLEITGIETTIDPCAGEKIINIETCGGNGTVYFSLNETEINTSGSFVSLSNGHNDISVWDDMGVTIDTFLFFDIPPCELFIPNIFSPNGDGVNDLFEISAPSSLKETFGLTVYDRWGEIVFSAGRQNGVSGWNGYFNGQKASSGVYVYILIYGTSREVVSGTVTLIY